MIKTSFLCRLRSIAAHRDHFVRRLSVRLSGSHTFLVVMHSNVSQATRAFLGMLPLCLIYALLKSVLVVSDVIVACIHVFILFNPPPLSKKD